ncbi:MAG: hypothetical protein EHM65_08130, partial [Acidobacteriales bacterium]
MAAACLAAVVLLVGLAHTPLARGFLLSRVAGHLRSQGIDFSADRLVYNLLTLSVWLEGVSVGSATATQQPPFLRVQSVAASLSASELLRGMPVVENAELRGV